MADWKQSAQQLAYKLFDPFIQLLMRWKVTPNMITFLGLLINVAAAGVFIYGAELKDRGDHSIVGLAGIIILLGGMMDMVDGRLARVAHLESKFGALYDSVLDRYSEMIMFLGICYYLISFDYFLSSLFAFIAMIGSIMVSYTRARAEGLGVKMSDIGLLQRPERILIVGVSAVLCGLFSKFVNPYFKIDVDFLPFPLIETITIFTFPLFVLAIGANLTAIRRLNYAKKYLQENA